MPQYVEEEEEKYATVFRLDRKVFLGIATFF
jgi:hypothetical protein